MGLAMVRRTLSRLKGSKVREVSRVRLPNGVWVYFLAKRGAERLCIETGEDVTAVRLRSFGTWEHRAICNWHVISWKRFAARASQSHQLELYTEYEIQTGRTPLLSWDDTVPDALGVYTNEDDEVYFWWMEVENSRRNDRGKRQLANFLINRYRNPKHKSGIAFGVIHLVSTKHPLLLDVCRDLRRRLDKHTLTAYERSDIEDKVLFFSFPMSSGLIADDSRYFAKRMYEFDQDVDELDS